jgi:hypothetical protein
LGWVFLFFLLKKQNPTPPGRFFQKFNRFNRFFFRFGFFGYFFSGFLGLIGFPVILLTPSHFYKFHGLPIIIATDRDNVFTSLF